MNSQRPESRRNFLKASLAALVSSLSLLPAWQSKAAALAVLPAQNQWLQSEGGNAFSFSALGDMGTGWSSEYKLTELIAKSSPQSVFLLGDILYPKADLGLIESNFAKPFSGLIAGGTRFYPCWGNHDWAEKKAINLKNYFAAPDYYTFQQGPAQFWSLNSNQFDSAQRLWFSESLKASQSKWKLVFCHHPPFSRGAVHGNSPNLIRDLVPLLDQYGVQLCLSAHSHLYERSAKIGSTVFITSGGGSASLHDIKLAEGYQSLVCVKEHHFLSCTGNPRELKLQATGIDGRIIDYITIN